MKKLQILIADDHPIFRRGLRDILSEGLPAAHFQEVETGEQALDLIRKQPWDAVLLDIRMPGRSGLEILADLKREKPDVRVLILSAAAEEQYGVRVLKAGASGFITKLRAPLEIAAAVKQVLAGGVYVGPALAARLASEVSGRSCGAAYEKLSDREMEVLRGIGGGKSLKEIAAELSLSVQTVSTYRARILEKLALHTTADLIRYGLENNLVGP